MTTVFSQESDTLLTKSGEYITGKIKKMNKEILFFETSYSENDFQIDWEQVESLISVHKYKIYDTRGNQYLGIIGSSSDSSGLLVIKTENDTITRKLSEITIIAEAQETLRDRLDLGIHLGYNFTKASSTQQFTSRSSAGYTGDKWDLTSNINSYNTRLDTTSTSRTDANINLRVSMKNNWYAFGGVDWLTSEAQQLSLRTSASFAAGNFVVRNSDTYLYLFGGMTYNNEKFSGEEAVEVQSMEGLIGGQLELFGYSDISLNSKIYTYPSITQKRRIRTLLSFDLKWEFISDFELIAGFSLNYDSNPPGNTEKSDYVFSLTLGWSL